VYLNPAEFRLPFCQVAIHLWCPHEGERGSGPGGRMWSKGGGGKWTSTKKIIARCLPPVFLCKEFGAFCTRILSLE